MHLAWKTVILAGCCALMASVNCKAAQLTGSSEPGMIPRIVRNHGRYALYVDGAPYLILGGQAHNSSDWPATLPGVWKAGEHMNANTIELPIYWEQFEPQQGKFDNSTLDLVLKQAREHHFHLVLLWFGSWKNGNMSYTPTWIKTNPSRYPRAEDANGLPLDSLSAVSESNLNADRTAFSAFMRHLKTADSEHTVLMVQVENEAGMYRSTRDYSPAAQKLFNGQVPETLLNALHKHAGTWREVFGASADEDFQAWSVARYIGEVAQAGKAECSLPLYVNAALRDPLPQAPSGYNLDTSYPSVFEYGGPTDLVLEIWKAAAPAIDLIAPDNYFSDYPRYTRALDLYRRPDNALFVPETGGGPGAAGFLFTTVGYGGIGFSPFGIDSVTNRNISAQGIMNPQNLTRPTSDAVQNPDALAIGYALLGSMDREIARWNFDGKLQAVSKDPNANAETMMFGKWKAIIRYGLPPYGDGHRGDPDPVPQGSVLVVQLSADSFLVTGFHARVDFRIADPESTKQRQFLTVEEGGYHAGQWKTTRLLNGDETDFGLNFSSVPEILKVTLATY